MCFYIFSVRFILFFCYMNWTVASFKIIKNKNSIHFFHCKKIKLKLNFCMQSQRTEERKSHLILIVCAFSYFCFESFLTSTPLRTYRQCIHLHRLNAVHEDGIHTRAHTQTNKQQLFAYLSNRTHDISRYICAHHINSTVTQMAQWHVCICMTSFTDTYADRNIVYAEKK